MAPGMGGLWWNHLLGHSPSICSSLEYVNEHWPQQMLSLFTQVGRQRDPGG